jgi:FHS family L-fucose permease-like MFS transporter
MNTRTEAPSGVPAPPETGRYAGALATVTTLFFMWGFLTSLNDILVPHLKSIFDLNYAEVMLIQFAFFSAYFVFSIPSGKLIDWIGYKKAMVAGLLTMGVGALLFVPAASVPSFPLFLAALIVLAAGITALQVAANPYVTVLGPAKTASSRLNLTQAFNSFGTFLGPLLGGLFILSAAPKSVDELRLMSAQALQAYRLSLASSSPWRICLPFRRPSAPAGRPQLPGACGAIVTWSSEPSQFLLTSEPRSPSGAFWSTTSANPTLEICPRKSRLAMFRSIGAVR